MRKGSHLVIGFLAFFVYACLLNGIHSINAGSFIIGIFTVAAGSVTPDILEAPTSSKHRRTLHCRRVLKGTGVLFGITAILYLLPILPQPGKLPDFCLSCFFLGYLFHLIADSTTRRGLPE
jgi:membrane-bound metal-dependent hydrolase YbcI (DUF457 family)